MSLRDAAYEHWTQTGHATFRKRCSAGGCDGDVAWETLFNWFCEGHRPRHPFRWRTGPELRMP